MGALHKENNFKEDMFEIHKQTNNIYNEHKNAFDAIERIFFEEHSIPREVTRDTVKQRILGGIVNEMPNKWIISPREFAPSLMRYAASMCYLLWCALFGRSNQKVEAEVLFEYWYSDSDSFYDGILKELPSLNIAAISPSIDEGHKHSRIPASKRVVRKSKPFSRKAARVVLKSHYRRFGMYWSLTKQTHLDFVDLALRLCSEVAGHISSIEGVSSKILVSALDNGYSPYRYHLYRSNGVGLILLIQNGGRVGLTEYFNSYIYCDYYIGWSQQRLDDFIEMHCKNKIPLGSIKLSSFLLNRGNKETNILYDVIFAEQNYEPPHPQNAFYLKLVQNLVRFSSENPGVRVAYCRRPGMFAHPALCAQIDMILRDNPVTMLDSTSNLSSYEHALKSSILVSLDSSLRCEAIMLGKPVISCSNRCDDYIVQYSDPCFVISTDSYYEFSSKLSFLLDNLDAILTSNSFARLRKAVGNMVEENVSLSVANLIKAELHRVETH